MLEVTFTSFLETLRVISIFRYKNREPFLSVGGGGRMTNYSQQPHLECNDHCIELFVGFVLEGILILIISIFGIIGNGATTVSVNVLLNLGNITCVFVFNHKSVDLKPSFSNILKCLSIFDILFLVRFPLLYKLRISLTIFQSGVISLYSLPNLWSWYVTVEPITTPVILPLTQIAMTGSVYSVVAVAVERYFNICKPFRANWVR